MPTFTQGSSPRTAVRQSISIDATGNVSLTLSILDATGITLETRTIRIPADSSAIVDTNGAQIAASVPLALSGAITAFVAQVDAAIASAATAGKFGR